jgi:hypothetical protein
MCPEADLANQVGVIHGNAFHVPALHDFPLRHRSKKDCSTEEAPDTDGATCLLKEAGNPFGFKKMKAYNHTTGNNGRKTACQGG